MGRVTDAFTWYLTRTSGLLGWVLLAVATLWGLLLTSRLLERRPSPAWLLDLHRHLGTLTLVLTVVHVGAIVADDFVDYSLNEALLPFASDVDRIPVTLGVISLYLLVVVQGSSLIRGRLRAAWWRGLHLLSAPLLVLAGVHGWLIGTDIGNPLVATVAIVLGAEILLVLALRVRFGRRSLPTRIS
jgi:methionine sulfoxide reductase heme-binding subunit